MVAAVAIVAVAAAGFVDAVVDAIVAVAAVAVVVGAPMPEEFGGEARLRELFAQHIAEQGQPEDPLAAAAEVREVYINDLGPPPGMSTRGPRPHARSCIVASYGWAKMKESAGGPTQGKLGASPGSPNTILPDTTCEGFLLFHHDGAR